MEAAEQVAAQRESVLAEARTQAERIHTEAVERLRNPQPRIEVGVMAGVAGGGLAGNLLVLAWLRHDKGINARSAFLHVLGDAISSVAVLGAALAMWLRPSLQWLDPEAPGLADLILRILAES